MIRKCLPLAALAAGILLWTPSSAQEDGYVPIFNGKDFTGLKFAPASIDATKTWSVKNGVIECTGTPNGYFYTEKPYKNYSLKLDFKYPEKAGNSGYLIHITGDHKVWPKCIEVQGQYGGAASIFPIGGVKGPRGDDAEARKKAIKPHTEWNSIEIVSQDGKLTSFINGTKIAEAGPYDVVEGPIGFQSEGAPIHFKDIRIKELK